MDVDTRRLVRQWVRSLGCVLTLAVVVSAGDTPEAPKPDMLKLINPGAAPQQLLTYRFALGQFVNCTIDQNHVVQTRYENGNEKVVNQNLSQKNLRIVAVESDGTAVLEPLVKKVRMSAKFNELEPIVFDSDAGGEAASQFRAIQATVGRPLARMTFAPNGELTKIVPLQGAPDELARSAAKTDPTSNFLVVFPKEPIGVGAVWREKFVVQVSAGAGGGIAPPVTMQREYQLTKIENGLATISLKTSTLTPLGNPQAEAQLLSRLLMGTIEFDIAKGMLVSHVTKAEGQVVEAFGPKTLMYSKLVTTERWTPSPEGVQPATLKEVGATR